MTTKDPLNRREQILDAAEKIAAKGASGFTLEAVAAAAQVSKGGVLHHFRSKEALAVAMVNRSLEAFEAAVDAMATTLTGPAPWARAFLQVSLFAVESAPAGASDRRLIFFGAAALEPALMAPVQLRYAAWSRRLETDVSDPVLAATVRAVADGCWWADVFRLAPPDHEVRTAIVRRIDDLLGA